MCVQAAGWVGLRLSLHHYRTFSDICARVSQRDAVLVRGRPGSTTRPDKAPGVRRDRDWDGSTLVALMVLGVRGVTLSGPWFVRRTYLLQAGGAASVYPLGEFSHQTTSSPQASGGLSAEVNEWMHDTRTATLMQTWMLLQKFTAITCFICS